ncbi:MAG TPA: TonB-dependent receptor [Granulicella sp.]|nr:TonB-dependent receptor [Granulicella sp.]
MRKTFTSLGRQLLVVMLAVVGTSALIAQTDTGRVLGTVLDPTGAAVPGATITIKNLQNNSVRTVKSGGSGDFSVTALPPGSYRADVQAQGFGSQQQNFNLDVSQVQALNFKLTVGSEATSVTVTDAAPIVQTESSQTGLVINDRQLSDLPLNGRNFTQLALLTPGVTRGAYGNQASGVSNNVETLRYNDTGGASLSANGLRPQANNFLLDGLDNNESMVNTINFFPPVEAMSEFRVTNSLAPAEFGRAGGLVTQAITKSGTNQIHGSAFEFYRDLALGGANENYFAAGVPEPSQHRHQFGGTIGFPIFKDKLFFFADYQGLRENIPNGGASLNTVPTAKMRTGDFSELLGGGLTSIPYNYVGGFAPDGCASFTTVHGLIISDTKTLNNSIDNGAIFDPLTCSQFNYNNQPNHIDPARLNKVGVNYLNVFPLPNHTAINGVRFNYAQAQFIKNKYNDFDIRLDYHLKSKDLMFVRYSYGQDNDDKTTAITGLPAGYGAGENNTHPRGIAAGETHIFTANIINEFRFGYSRPFYGYINPMDGVPFSQDLGIPNANRTALLGGGALIGGNYENLSYTGDGGSYQVPQHIWQYSDSVSYNHGAHTLKFGGSLILRHVDFFQGSNAKGFFQYQGTGSDFTGFDTSEVLAGFVNTYSIGNADSYFLTRTYELGFFAQDDWKLTRRLTVNAGLRYDLYNFPYEANNRLSNFNIVTGQLDVAGTNGLTRSIVNTPKTNFAPRIGFAYDLFGNGKAALRGGYGIYYFIERGGIGNQLSNNPDFNGSASYNDYTGYRVALSGQTASQQPANSNTPGPWAVNNSALATSALPAAGASVNEANPTNANVIGYDLHPRLPMVQQYNLSLQQEIEKNTTVTIAYVGTKSDHLMATLGYNGNQLGTGLQFFPNRGLNVSLNRFEGTSHYNGLQTSLNHRLVNGLQVTAAYTWSHNTDDVPSPYDGGSQTAVPITAQGPTMSLNRGNADDDQRHAATFSALIEVPYGRGRRFGSNTNKGLNYLVGGWQLSPFVSMGSGTPFDLMTYGDSDGVAVRPDLVGTPHVGLQKDYANSGSGFVYLNASAFRDAPKNSAGLYTRVGNVHRNAFYGPGYNTTGLSVFKSISLTERIKSELRGQAYNLFNHPQFANPINLNIDQYTTGPIVNQTRFRSAREIELAYRVTF